MSNSFSSNAFTISRGDDQKTDQPMYVLLRYGTLSRTSPSADKITNAVPSPSNTESTVYAVQYSWSLPSKGVISFDLQNLAPPSDGLSNAGVALYIGNGAPVDKGENGLKNPDGSKYFFPISFSIDADGKINSYTTDDNIRKISPVVDISTDTGGWQVNVPSYFTQGRTAHGA